MTKLNPTGSGLLYSTYLGGNSDDRGQGIALDAAGNAYVTGFTFSNNFPTTVGAFRTTCACTSVSPDAFVTKLNGVGSALVYSTYLGGSGADSGDGIAVDTTGDAYVTGVTYSTDFPTTTGAFQTVCASCNSGFPDVFVTKLNPAGSGPLVYSTYLGGSLYDAGTGIALDAVGNAYVTGTTFSSNFPTTSNAIQPTSGGGPDAFVTVLSPLGSAPPIYSSYLGGNSNDFGQGIAVDAIDNAYLTGYTLSTNFPTTMGAFQTSNHGVNNAFVTKISNIVCTQTIESLTAKPNVLWPPNHKLIPVTVTAKISGNCSAVVCKIVSVTSNEPIDSDDAVITGDLTVKLRAERSGDGTGRVYTITVQCTDAAGNVTVKTVTVTVPHDQGDGGDDDQGNNGDGGDQGDYGHDNGNGNGHGHGGDSVRGR